MQYSLYYSPYCPFCMRVLNVIKTLPLEITLKNIDQDIAAARELVQGGGQSMVPCLRIDNDGETQWMYESADIIQYLTTTAAQ